MQITLENVVKTYEIQSQSLHAVKSASLGINRGDFVSIVGHSGSGKTTLLSMIGGIVGPTSGRILFEGQDICTLNSDQISEYRSGKIGFMFQFASLLPVLTVRENLLLPTIFAGVSGIQERAEQKAIDLIRMVGLFDKIDSYPSQLSGGQQRRVAIARAFMNNPEVVLADEPTGDLDEETEAEMMKFFRNMNKNESITFIIVTHNSDLAGQAERRLIMHQGVLEEI